MKREFPLETFPGVHIFVRVVYIPLMMQDREGMQLAAPG